MKNPLGTMEVLMLTTIISLLEENTEWVLFLSSVLFMVVFTL